MEYWSIGVMVYFPITPTLQYSSVPKKLGTEKN
jgi:hypothetical protein